MALYTIWGMGMQLRPWLCRHEKEAEPNTKRGMQLRTGLCRHEKEAEPNTKRGMQLRPGLCRHEKEAEPNTKRGLQLRPGLYRHEKEAEPNTKRGLTMALPSRTGMYHIQACALYGVRYGTLFTVHTVIVYYGVITLWEDRNLP